MKNINDLKNKIDEFTKNREWDRFHSPKNLSMALSGEAGELIEIFQWLTDEESYLKDTSNEFSRVREEISDIFIYLVMLSDKLGIDLINSALDKIELNAKKYPIEQSKNSAKKYTEYHPEC